MAGNSLIDAIAKTGAADQAQTTAAEVRANHAAIIGRVAQAPGSKETFEKFEAMVLQNFVQSMLPQEAESVYGAGMSGDIWKSFLAKGIADQMARGGGIGIAERVLGDHYLEGEKKVALTGVSHDPNKPRLDQENTLSSAVIHEMQRTVVRSMSEDMSLQSATGVFSEK
ncbi:MAG: rod-binding protein [Mesorhizobium sp.]